MTNVEKFRPGGAVASGWLLTFFFGGFIVQTIFYGGDFVLTTAICGAGIVAAYLLFLKPYVLIFDEGIQIINPTKEITATWDLVEEIETKFSMSITVDGAQYFAWAAPAPGHRHSRRMHKSDLLPGSDVPRRLGDSPQSDSGACSYIAKKRRKAFVKNNPSNFNLRSDSRLIYLIDALIIVALVSIFL